MLQLASVQDGLHPQDAIDQYEDVLKDLPQYNCHTEHHFWGGFYCRQVRMPAGLQGTTKTHGKRHSFQITEGKVEVVDNGGKAMILEAPYVGITEPGTRRALHILEECVWTTFHATDAQSVEEAEQDLIIPRPREGIAYANAFNQHDFLLHND
jgi:hypothetical protein